MTPTPNPPALLPVTQEPDISRIALWNVLRERGVSQDIAQIIIAKAAEISPAASTPAEPKVSREKDLREALEPFAVTAAFDLDADDDEVLCQTEHGCHCVKVGHFRRASAALSNPPADGDGWRDIKTCETWRFDHMNTMLAVWDGRVRETYFDIDDDFDSRPDWWVSPREGWRSPGDQCIPVNQDSVTHWMPKPSAPLGAAGQIGEQPC